MGSWQKERRARRHVHANLWSCGMMAKTRRNRNEAVGGDPVGAVEPEQVGCGGSNRMASELNVAVPVSSLNNLSPAWVHTVSVILHGIEPLLI